MEEKSATWRLTPDVVKAKGKDPEEVVNFMHKMLTTAIDDGLMLVTHNGWKFDYTMLQALFRECLNVEFVIPPDQMLDTGMIIKQAQLYPDPIVEAMSTDTLQSYFHRISNIVRKGVRWSVSYCLDKYGLDKVASVTSDDLHGAMFDARVVHHLLEKFRELGEAELTEDIQPLPPIKTAEEYRKELKEFFDEQFDVPTPKAIIVKPQSTGRKQRNR
jgi:hypothetical protein